MGNHILTTPTLTTVMEVSEDGKYVITRTIIEERRPIKYYVKDLLELDEAKLKQVLGQKVSLKGKSAVAKPSPKKRGSLLRRRR